MTDEQIRRKIQADECWNKTLNAFEHLVCEVEFTKNSYSYGIMRKGAKGFYDDMFTTIQMKSVESLVLFMQGALWFRLHGKEFK